VSGLTRELALFAIQVPVPSVPLPVRDLIRGRLAQAAGLAAAHAAQPSPEALVRTLAAFSNSDQVGLLGRRERLGLCDAPVVTASAVWSGWQSLCREDGGLQASNEAWPDGPVAAAALAVGEYTNADGVEVLNAVLLGTEIGLRVEWAMSAAYAVSGWTVGAVASRLGAAVAAGRLLGLNADQMVSALGLAATEVAGLADAATSPAGAVTVGKAAGDGVEAAVLALEGFHGPAAPLEGRRGLLAILTPGLPDLQSITRALGSTWRVSELTDRDGRTGWLGDGHTAQVALELLNHKDMTSLLEASHG